MTNRGRFKPGVSGNPAGRPRGARHRATVAAEALLDGEAEALTRRAIELALDGDTVALRLCLERIAPRPRGRLIGFDLPAGDNASDLRTASLALLRAVAEGRISAEEAGAVAPLIEGARRAIETGELARRVEALEQALEARGDKP